VTLARFLSSPTVRVDGKDIDPGGRSAKLIGDALMIRLDDAVTAVGLGLAIVERTADTPSYPNVRVGMNTGSAVERAGDWFGAAVNLAARVASEAEGCEVLLTQSTVDLAGEVEGIRLKPLGERRLKNVSQPVRIYRASRPPSSSRYQLV